MRRLLLIVGFLLAIALLLEGHAFYTTRITWSADVSRVVYRNCISCHHPGGTTPSLMTFREARPWAEDIKVQVLERRMPPWNAVKGFGEFKDDHGLPQEDLELIAEWVEGGCPEGNPAYMPSAPEFPTQTANASIEERNGLKVRVTGNAALKHAVSAIGVEPLLEDDHAMLQAIAHYPSGEIEPLIWIENFNPGYSKPYYFREPLQLPAGTRIELSPPQATINLLVQGTAHRAANSSPISSPKPVR